MEGCPKALMINFDLKEISSIEEDAFEKPLTSYIREYYNEDPKDYSKEVQQITQLRKGLSSIPRDKNGCNSLRKYYTQLHYLQSRFPMASGGVASVPFIWHDIYSGEPNIYNDVRYEQACILFNLGGLYSQLGANEGRLTDDSMKVACTHFQSAAGIYSYLKDNFILSEMPDMTDEILALKVAVMLGQALECILEKSIRDDKNQELIARICIQVKDYFNEAIDYLNHNGTSEMGSYLRKSWAKHLKIKVYCYEALAYSYMSNDSVKKEQYGHQVSYLKHANEQITEASRILKNQSDRVIEMVNFVMDVVGNKCNAAVKDNDFIYHMSIPDFTALEEIKPVNFVKPLPFTFDDPTISGPDIFQKLIPLRAHEASSVYSEKKAEILRQVIASVQEKDTELGDYMTALKIEDLIDPKEDSLPDELIAKNKFLQDNPDIFSKVEKDIEELAIKASKLDNLYSELREKLQVEKDEQGDGEMPSEFKVLFDELGINEDAHLKASKINNELVKIINEKKEVIMFLSGNPTSILQSLPSQNIVEAPTDEPIVQRIREILGKVEKMKTQRQKLISQLRDELNKDDITALLAVRDQGDKETFFEGQVKKHDERIGYINQNLMAQSNIIQALTEANAKYATTREKSNAISAQFEMQVKSYTIDITMFLDVKDRIRNGLDFYKRLEDDVSRLEPRINLYCEGQDKKRPKKPLAGKAPPSRPTARKPDIMKTAATPPGHQIPFSNNTMMGGPRFIRQQAPEGTLPPTTYQGQLPMQRYNVPVARPGVPQPVGNPPLQPPFNPQGTQPPGNSPHAMYRPEQRFPVQQNQFPPRQPVQPGTRFPSHPNPGGSTGGIPPQANSSFNQSRQIAPPIISTQGSIGQNKPLGPLQGSRMPQNIYHNPPGPAHIPKGNVQRVMQNPHSQPNQPNVIRHPHPPGVQQHLTGVHQHPVTNMPPSGVNAPTQIPPQGQSQQIRPHQPGNLAMHIQPSQPPQQPQSIGSGMRKVQVNAHQLPTQQQSTVVSNYTHPQQQQQSMQHRYPSQSSKPLQHPTNYPIQPKGVAPQPITQQRYPLQGGNQIPTQYPSQPDLISSQYPSQTGSQQQMNSPHHPPKLQQASVPQLPQHSIPNQQQSVSQHQFPSQFPSANTRFSSQPMENQNQMQYPMGNRQVQLGQHSSIQQPLHPEQQRKPQLQHQFQQPPQQQHHQHMMQQQQQQPQHNILNPSQNQFRPQHGPPLLMQKNIPAQQNILSQQQYDNNVAKLHHQGYQRMGGETSPIIDLLSDNTSLPLPLVPEKTGEKVDKLFTQMLPLDDPMIYPRGSVNDNNMPNRQLNSNVIPPVAQMQPSMQPVPQAPAFVKQESNELIYPRQHPQEKQVSAFAPNSTYPGHTDFVSNQGIMVGQVSPNPHGEGHSINKKLNIAIPSAPMNQATSMFNQPDFQNHISSPMPYSGPSITQSNSSNHSGVLFASKPMMSPTMTPQHDPVISNILGKNVTPNIDMTQIAQLNFQQIHLQSMVIQQQQLIAMLQTQQTQQRSEEENKIHLLQQQISEQQKLINNIKGEKEKEDKNVELQAFLEYEKLIKKIQAEEQAKKENVDNKDEMKQSENKKSGNLQKDSASVMVTLSSQFAPSSTIPSACAMIENDITECNANGISKDLSSAKKDIGKSVVINASVLPDVLNLGKENSNSGITTVLSDVISDNVPNGNVTNNQIPFYEPKLDTIVTNDDDDSSLIVPRDMEDNVVRPDNDEDTNVPNKTVPHDDDEDDIIQPRSGDDNIQPRSGDDNIQPHFGDDNIQPCTDGNADTKSVKLENDELNVKTEQKSVNVSDLSELSVKNDISVNETSNGTSVPVVKERKSIKDDVSPSPNTSKCSSKKSTPNTSGRSSPASNSQCVQLDDIDNQERKISESIDHRHLARQLGRNSYYVPGPEEIVWLTYIQELDVAVAKLQLFCKSLCKRVENMDIDGFLKIWNDLAKFEELDVRNFSSTAGESNISKNRYRDILPWDHTRVKLSTMQNDYINANCIETLTPYSPQYVATQGPIPQTFSDFWTMVWEQKSQIIVMLTNEVEGTKLKCHHYWGREVDSRIEFDDLIIILTDETTTSGWKIRTFSMVDKKSEDTRMVKQFQFTSWPDYGTPESPYELLTFMEDIYQCHQQLDLTFESPLILHCSAGVGRTGSFCCIYSAIREMQGQNGLIDIPGVIRKLRQYRPHMVQRKEQLIFCYQAVLCFAQQFTATEMHKISNPRFQDKMLLAMDISNEENSHKKDNETSASKEVTSNLDNNMSNGNDETLMGATSRDSDQGADIISGNSKFKINSGIFQSSRTSCVDQSNTSNDMKLEED